MDQMSLFDTPQQNTGDAQNPSVGVSTPSAYTEPQDHPRPQRKARVGLAQKNVDQLRRRPASLTDEIDQRELDDLSPFINQLQAASDKPKTTKE